MKVERRYIERVLEARAAIQSSAARALDIDPKTLHRKLGARKDQR